MLKIRLENCAGCGLCAEVCPLGILRLEGKKIRLSEGCVECRTCSKACPSKVFEFESKKANPVCTSCPVMCAIPEGGMGACHRYTNRDGEIRRKARLVTIDEVRQYLKGPNQEGGEPLITGIGSGTTYPDFRPSPVIVSAIRDSIQMVTVVTEAPLSYSGLKLKLDTDQYLGTEGKRIFTRIKGKRHVGHLCTEEYGSKILSLGGVNILTSKHGLFAARIIKEIIDGKEVTLTVEEGAQIKARIGSPPLIGEVLQERMRVGCGSATTGLFAPYMAYAADEVIVLDGHITALFTEHPCGRFIGKPRTGIFIKGQKSTDGRYFLDKGDGWGGTTIKSPLDVIDRIDKDSFRPGMTLLVTETTGERYAFFTMGKDGLLESGLPAKAGEFLAVLRDSCETTRVSGIFAAGVGGSARAGVTKNPIRLTRAVHRGEVKVTVGGAKPFILPGGGINFLVDVEKIRFGSIYTSPTPSFILPIEYTMTHETFRSIGGHLEAVRPLEEVLSENRA
ncbi:MAG: 6-hydroxynicotinate reductase [Desulfobacteraceae bacterium]|nr:MAG: 6-hydroxynicotinate reductase [Desulfobacteraceae bacterium]